MGVTTPAAGSFDDYPSSISSVTSDTTTKITDRFMNHKQNWGNRFFPRTDECHCRVFRQRELEAKTACAQFPKKTKENFIVFCLDRGQVIKIICGKTDHRPLPITGNNHALFRTISTYIRLWSRNLSVYKGNSNLRLFSKFILK